MAPLPYQTYSQLQAVTSSQAELIVLLYRGAVRFSTKARIHMVGGQVEQAHTCLMRAQQVLVELMVGIRPGEAQITHELFALHHYIYRVLCDANLRKDVTLIDEALTHLRGLLQTWEQIAFPAATRARPPAGVVAIDQRC